MERVVDYWAGWYAATMMVVAALLAGGALWLIAKFLGLPRFVGTVLFWGAGAAGVWLGYRAFHNVAKGLVFDPADGTVEVPASRPSESFRDLTSLSTYRQLLRREKIAISAISSVTDRDTLLFDSRKRLAGQAFYLDVEGSFGWHAIYFRSPEKRAEAHGFFNRLMTRVPTGRSVIPRSGS